MRPTTIMSALVLVLVGTPALHGCGGAPTHSITVGALPAGASFTGVWFSPEYGEMHIEQSGATAVGRYFKDERAGRLQGSIEGDVMRFEWTENRELIVGRQVETKGHGYFKIYKNEAEDTWNLKGEWGTDASETGGGPWSAVKSKTRRPDVAGTGGSTSAGSTGSGEGSSDDSSGGEGGEGSDDLDGL